MSPRYLIIAADEGPLRTKAIHAAEALGLAQVFTGARLIALANSACPCLALGDHGCILGHLFHRAGPAARIDQLAPGDAHAVVHSDCGSLLAGFWGSYVAVIVGEQGTIILRDPTGTFPSYHAGEGEFGLFASDATILAACGVAGEIDSEEIGRELYRSFVPRAATALQGVKEMLPGFALRSFEGRWSEQAVWTPWNHTRSLHRPSAGAAEHLAAVVQRSVEGLAAAHGRLLLSVSGGLDSSIIAACLARGGADTICLTMFTEDAAGDERAYARALCAHLKLPLIERPYRLDDIDLDEPLAPQVPRPRDRTQANAYERVHLEVAADVGAQAFVTGNGGDHVFGYSQSAAPVADRVLAEGLGRGALRSLFDVCAQTGCNITDALVQAWRLGRARPDYRVQPSPLYLAPDFVAGLDASELRHPWLDAPPNALPGKAAHIAAILRLQPNVEASRGLSLPLLTPLLAQPIVETCLAIPSWQWREGGRDRSIARQAFSQALPTLILGRRIKGSPGRFAARLLDHFRGAIRERVLDGRLAADRVVDRAALERTLQGSRPVSDVERIRILELVNAEAWIRHWSRR